MDFGYTLRTMRKAAGLSLRRLARQVGVSAAYLSQVERGALPAPTLPRLRDIAQALGLPPSYLLGLTNRTNAEVLDFVNEVPEAGGFLRVAREKGLDGPAFQLLAEIVETLEPAPFTAALESLRADPAEAPHRKRDHVQLVDYLEEGLVWHRLLVRTKKELLRVLVEGVARAFPRIDPNIALNRLLRREKEASTGIGNGIAIPHAALNGLSREVVSVATLAEGINFEAVDKQKVVVVFLLVGHESTRHDRLKLLARLAQLGAAPRFTVELRQARSRGELIERLRQADSRMR
jgi:mannitol/fructose-specific phosphotransferase system IIA component (Ntr-type)